MDNNLLIGTLLATRRREMLYSLCKIFNVVRVFTLTRPDIPVHALIRFVCDKFIILRVLITKKNASRVHYASGDMSMPQEKCVKYSA